MPQSVKGPSKNRGAHAETLTLMLRTRHNPTQDLAFDIAALVVDLHEPAETALIGRVIYSQNGEREPCLLLIIGILVFGRRISGSNDLLHAPVDERAIEFHFVVADEIVEPQFDIVVVGLFENPV